MGKQGKKTVLVTIAEEKPLTKSKFFDEEQEKKNEKSARSLSILWRTTIPDVICTSSIVVHLRTASAPQVCEEEEDGMDILKKSLLESKNIETVRKKNFFNEEVTEEEREIIAQRVALQQRQFAAYEYREKVRKSKKIRTMFDYIGDEEIQELLEDCEQDEDEVIYKLTQPGYLYDIRKRIALKYAKEEESYVPLMTADQKAAYQQLLKKRSVTLKKTTNDDAKKQYRMCGRLGLDEALEQVQNNQVDPEKAFEGWSQARIKAYQMIDQNPNSYYYRFNAPGEIQRKGQWDEDEKKMFHARLAEVGANGQWGLFSMTIPGRVGYQCSNYYRLLVETQQIHDPNYVLDERGKAHYLFDKKNADGKIQKTFRTHSKHTSSDYEPSSSKTSSSSTTTSTTIKKRKVEEESSSTTSTTTATTTTTTTTKPTANGTRKQPAKTRRRKRYQDSGSDSDDDESAFDNDHSGNFSTRAIQDADVAKSRRSKRQRRPTAAAVESMSEGGGLSSLYFDPPENDSEEDPTCPLPGFIDPITLEQVVKPAISKYGHVMGYDSWVRCLNNWEGKRNICPLTKKPLTKRDLVVITFENLDEYKEKIVNI